MVGWLDERASHATREKANHDLSIGARLALTHCATDMAGAPQLVVNAYIVYVYHINVFEYAVAFSEVALVCAVLSVVSLLRPLVKMGPCSDAIKYRVTFVITTI